MTKQTDRAIRRYRISCAVLSAAGLALTPLAVAEVVPSWAGTVLFVLACSFVAYGGRLFRRRSAERKAERSLSPHAS